MRPKKTENRDRSLRLPNFRFRWCTQRAPKRAESCRGNDYQAPQRSAAVWTGASQSRTSSSSSPDTVIEQPAISSEVT